MSKILISLLFIAPALATPTLLDIASQRHAELDKKIAACKILVDSLSADEKALPQITWLSLVIRSSEDIKAVLASGNEATWGKDRERIKAILQDTKIAHGPTAETDTQKAIVASKLPVEVIRALVQVNRSLRDFERLIFGGII